MCSEVTPAKLEMADQHHENAESLGCDVYSPTELGTRKMR